MALGLPNVRRSNQRGSRESVQDLMFENGIIREENSDMVSSSHMTMSASHRNKGSCSQEGAQEDAHLDLQVKAMAELVMTKENSFAGVKNKATSWEGKQPEMAENLSSIRRSGSLGARD